MSERQGRSRSFAILFGWVAIGLTAVGCQSTMESINERLPPLPTLSPRDSAPEQSPDSGAQSATTRDMEIVVYEQINEIRQQAGLTPLQPDSELARVARAYSQRMASENFFSHTSPDGGTFEQRLQSADIRYWLAGENLFTSTNAPQPAPLAVKGWMNSPGHRENILRSGFTATGIGVWQDGNTYYFTQLFIRPM